MSVYTAIEESVVSRSCAHLTYSRHTVVVCRRYVICNLSYQGNPALWIISPFCSVSTHMTTVCQHAWTIVAARQTSRHTFLSKSLMTNSWHTYPHPHSFSLDIPSTHFPPTWHTLAILVHMSSICHVQLRFPTILVMSMSCAVHFDAKSPGRFTDTTLRR